MLRRTFDVDVTSVNDLLDVLLEHLNNEEIDALDRWTTNTIAQFMIERKDVILRLLEYTRKCRSVSDVLRNASDVTHAFFRQFASLRQEAINAIKFISEVNSADDVELVLDHMPLVRVGAFAVEDESACLPVVSNIPRRISP